MKMRTRRSAGRQAQRPSRNPVVPRDRSFPIMRLPDEMRLLVYGHLLPKDQRLWLSRRRMPVPLPRISHSHPDALNFLLACKQLHAEGLQFILSHNIVNMYTPNESANFLKDLGGAACSFITCLEVHVQRGLSDLGRIWKTMDSCPKLRDLRLVFYHVEKKWLKTLAEVAHYISEQQEEGEEEVGDPRAGPVQLNLELYSSIWIPSYPVHDHHAVFKRHLKTWQPASNIFGFKLPSPLRRVTITASVSAEVGRTLNIEHATGRLAYTKHEQGPPEAHHYRWVTN